MHHEFYSTIMWINRHAGRKDVNIWADSIIRGCRIDQDSERFDTTARHSTLTSYLGLGVAARSYLVRASVHDDVNGSIRRQPTIGESPNVTKCRAPPIRRTGPCARRMSMMTAGRTPRAPVRKAVSSLNGLSAHVWWEVGLRCRGRTNPQSPRACRPEMTDGADLR
jgi:hypothetical protein